MSGNRLLNEEIYNSKLYFEKDFDLRLEKELLDSPLKENDVLIRTVYSLISPGTELALYTGTHVGISDPNNTFAKYPFYPGYALVGEIAAVGSDVEHYSIGDFVYATGKHASYNVLSTQNQPISPIIAISHQSELERIPFARLAGISMTAIIQSNIRVGDVVVVIGMGLIGNMAAQLYALLGAEVVVIDVVEERLLIAQQVGIQHTILATDAAQWKEKLQQLMKREQADIVVEATGSPHLVVPALELVKNMGQVIALGSTRSHTKINVYEHIHRKGVRFIGAHEGLQNDSDFPSNRYEITRYMLRLINDNILKIGPLITNKITYTEAQRGYEMLLHQRHEALGVLLQWK
ncbi:zinc-binding dehydrogenase [Paenibacillus yanchengensis]|uniref:Zinc-binding dehydrogenase n=1 Tax=Paenibacillus yanchengensis TaxID=2035833 RepID=A0ABW4YQ53_9BACL